MFTHGAFVPHFQPSTKEGQDVSLLWEAPHLALWAVCQHSNHMKLSSVKKVYTYILFKPFLYLKKIKRYMYWSGLSLRAVTCLHLLQLSMLDFPFPVVEIIYPQRNKFAMGVENNGTGSFLTHALGILKNPWINLFKPWNWFVWEFLKVKLHLV